MCAWHRKLGAVDLVRSHTMAENCKTCDDDTRELASPKSCHQNSVDEPVDGQDLSTLKRRYECQPAQLLAHQRISVLQPNLFTLKHRYEHQVAQLLVRQGISAFRPKLSTLKHRYRYAETPIRAR